MKPILNRTVSIRFNKLKIADLKRQAAEETIRRNEAVNYLDLIRQAVEAKYFQGGKQCL
jgi:hypothetical protein